MENRSITKTLAILGILLAAKWTRVAQSVTTEQDLTLTAKEKQALDKFRERIIPFVPHKYMTQDIYMIRWLRARNLDLNQAETMLRENLQWRKENKIDTITQEQFPELERDYPYQIEYEDKEGKPIITANFGDWDIRKLAVAGRVNVLNRWIDRGFELATEKVRKLQSQGKVISQFQFIINMDNYNLVQHGCLQCLPMYLHLVNSYESHFPGHADKIMLINTPPIFELVLNILRPIMSPLTRQTLKVYNANREQWQGELFKIAHRHELPPEYGGTKDV